MVSPACCTRPLCWTLMKAFASVDTQSQISRCARAHVYSYVGAYIYFSCVQRGSPEACMASVHESDHVAHENVFWQTAYVRMVQKKLPTAPGGSQPLPEGLLWLLLTGHVPTSQQVQGLSKDLMARSEIPSHVHAMLKSLPTGTHPMTQFTMAIMALQPDSLFAKAYQDGAQLQHTLDPQGQRISLYMCTVFYASHPNRY